jgi:hypothetical protein
MRYASHALAPAPSLSVMEAISPASLFATSPSCEPGVILRKTKDLSDSAARSKSSPAESRAFASWTLQPCSRKISFALGMMFTILSLESWQERLR